MAKLTSVWKRALPVIKRRLATLWLATAWPYIGLSICYMITGFVVRAYHPPDGQTDPLTLWHSMGVLARLGVVFAYLATISLPNGFAMAGASVVVWADLQGEAVRVRFVFSQIVHVLLRLVVLSFCIGGICLIGGMFFLVPGVLGFALLSFAIPVLVIEDTTVSTALRRGFKLSSACPEVLFGLYALVLFIVIVAVVLLFVVVGSVPPSADFPWWIGVSVFWVALVPLASILVIGTTAVVVELYRGLREQGGESLSGTQL